MLVPPAAPTISGTADEGDSMKTPLALASAALLAATLAGCGGSDNGPDSAYCKDLKSASTEFDSLSSSDVSKLDEAFKTFHKLAGEAPGEVKDDWTTLDKGITSVEKALKDAGLKFSDFADLQKGKMPEGVDVAKLQGLATEFQKLDSAQFDKASKAIEKHAKDVCKVDLSS
jgi:phage-related minor tail protein